MLNMFRERRKKGVPLTKFRSGIVVALFALAAVAAGSALAGTAASTTIVKFNASYAGAAVVKVTDQVADITTTGTGKGTTTAGTGKVTPIGAGKITGKGSGDASVQPCVPFTGTGSITGSKGAKLNFKMASGSQGCGDEAGEVFSVSGRVIVTGGAGVFKKAKGTLKLTGVYDRNKGSFAVKLAGKLTV